ncbi:MAG TPA: cyclic dehypoxanthinyl futalosine synthase [Acidobacteriota bacterium]|nr:cyclic dehypoxanthinyl futalosine synthase [Acidobacteriota bacterium]
MDVVVESSPTTILDKVYRGERLSQDEAASLFHNADLVELGMAADWVRMKKHSDRRVSFIIDRNINYTNVCNVECSFCAFYRAPGERDSYLHGFEVLDKKIEETLALGGTGILMQGGLHPELKIEWYEALLKHIKERYPIWIHGFSPPEILNICKVSRLPLPVVMERLISAGLDSLPGGGGEILVDRVRNIISPRKCMTDEWLEVHAEAHRQGLRSSATMMFGHVETLEERAEHLQRIRDLQDQTGGFMSYICWTFQPENTLLTCPVSTASDFLKTLAISRIFLDNIDNVQSSWLTQGWKLGQVALQFGANDMGSVMIEENVVSAAGAHYRATEEDLRRLIRDAGFQPVKRDTLYRFLEN